MTSELEEKYAYTTNNIAEYAFVVCMSVAFYIAKKNQSSSPH